MLSGMTIRNRLLLVAAIPVVALTATLLLLSSTAPAATAMVATGVAVVGVVAGLVLAVSVARTITSPLRRLGEAAERGSLLQALVEAQRRPSGKDRALALTPVGLPPGGEIGTVAAAFDEFQGAAARLAVGQAALLDKTVADRGTIEIFVNLARRMQGLVDHQIELLDGLEAEEEDADTLENLFELDRLGTRVRCTAERLLTLAGAASSRSSDRPLAMSDVIRAGMAEVEDIGRVDLLLDDDAAMRGNVAADAAHLLSELLENATLWSPAGTRVQVSGTPAAGGYAVTIEFRGMAVDALAEANRLLTGPPVAEAIVAHSLGLVVAGRLARRLGIAVRLASAASGGIVAKVLVPPTLMAAGDETLGLDDIVAAAPCTLPFALARQERWARSNSRRSRGRRPVPGASRPEATITQLPASRWMDEPGVRAEAPHRAEETASGAPAPAEPEWPAVTTACPPSPEAGWAPSEAPWTLAVRPARFAAGPSRPVAGADPARATAPSAEAKEDEYRRHLERATAAGLVRRVSKASPPDDTGGGAERAPRTGGDVSVTELLPEPQRPGSGHG